MKVTLALILTLANGILFFSPAEKSNAVNASSVCLSDLAKNEVLASKKWMKTVAFPIEQDASMALLDSIFNYICATKILHKDIVIKQVIWETGWLKGQYLMSRNNLFGFRAKEYLSFSSWQESVDYYEKWQQTYYLDPNEDYYKFLLRIKYSNSRYPGHLKSITYSKSCS